LFGRGQNPLGDQNALQQIERAFERAHVIAQSANLI